MGVGVESDGDGGVAQQFLNELRVDSTRQQDGGAGVAQVVETDLWQSGLIQQRLERALGQVVSVERGPDLRGEHEAVLPPHGPDPVYLL